MIRAALVRFPLTRLPLLVWACFWGSSTQLAFAEEPAKTETEPSVEVRGDRPPPGALSDRSVAGTTLSRSRFEAPGVSLPDALRQAPGVQVSQLGGFGAPATARLRGASSAQTAVYFGTVRLNDEVGGVADLATVPTSAVERVEVYRSQAPPVAILPGIGGALVLVPRTPRSLEASARATSGSFTTERVQGSLGGCTSAAEKQRGCLLGGFDLGHARNDYPFFDSRGVLLTNSQGEVTRLTNADSQQGSAWLTGKQNFGPAELRLVAEHSQREQGAPKLALVPTQKARASFQRTLLGLDFAAPWDAVRGSLGLTSSVLWAGTTLRDPWQELGLGTEFVDTPGLRFEQAAHSTQNVLPWLDISEQAAFSYEGLSRSEALSGVLGEGRTAVVLAASRLSARLGGEVNVHGSTLRGGGPWSARASASASCFGTSEAASPDLCQQVLPGARGSVLYAKGSLDLYAGAAWAARVPTLSELYGVSLLVHGSDTLRPERATTVETGARYQLRDERKRARAWLDASAFARFSQDLIVYARTAQGYLVPQNRDTARTLGAELTLGAEPLVGFELEGNLTLLDPRDTSPGRTTQDLLPFLSPIALSTRAGYAWDLRSGALERLRFGATFFYESSRYADAAGLAVVPEQSFVDLELGSHWFRQQSAREVNSRAPGFLEVALRVSNVFDQRRFDIVGFPLPGRAWFMTLGLHLP